MLGIFIVGMAVGLASRALHPAGHTLTVPMALLLGGLGALFLFYLGRSFGLFTDGQMIGWGAAMLGAAVFAGIGGLFGGRRTG